MKREAIVGALAVILCAAPIDAQQTSPQKPPVRSPTMPKPSPQKPKVPRQNRWFLALGGGIQAPGGDLSDQFTFEEHAEAGSTSAEYASKVAPMFDIGIGRRFWRTGGVAGGFSWTSFTGTAQTESDVPHPFFDDRDRHVSGEVSGLGRTETSAHVQLFWVRERRRWHTRVLGGLTYFRVRQDVVTDVTVVETYPYDTAEFARATTSEASGSGFGFNAGVDVAWMQTPRFGWGGAVRYTRGIVDLNITGGRSVSTDAGGAQALAGVRIAF